MPESRVSDRINVQVEAQSSKGAVTSEFQRLSESGLLH